METAKDKSRVLVVDDEPQVSEVLRQLLAAEGYEVRTADEGREALAFFSAWPPALVITDLNMMPIDGLELCRRIRTESLVPIIVVSADDGEQSKVAALDSGADDYVVKPFGPDELMARVRAVIRRAPTDTGGGSVDAGDFRIDLD